MNALMELLEQAKKNRKNKVHVISTEFVIKKIREYIKHDALSEDVEGTLQAFK